MQLSILEQKSAAGEMCRFRLSNRTLLIASTIPFDNVIEREPVFCRRVPVPQLR